MTLANNILERAVGIIAQKTCSERYHPEHVVRVLSPGARDLGVIAQGACSGCYRKEHVIWVLPPRAHQEKCLVGCKTWHKGITFSHKLFHANPSLGCQRLTNRVYPSLSQYCRDILLKDEARFFLDVSGRSRGVACHGRQSKNLMKGLMGFTVKASMHLFQENLTDKGKNGQMKR